MFQYPLPSGWGQPSEDAGSALGRLGRDFCNAGEWVSFSTPQFLYAVSWEEARQESFFLALDAEACVLRVEWASSLRWQVVRAEVQAWFQSGLSVVTDSQGPPQASQAQPLGGDSSHTDLSLASRTISIYSLIRCLFPTQPVLAAFSFVQA